MTDNDRQPAWFTDMQAEQCRGLAVGARVRVRLSGECPQQWCKNRDGQEGVIMMVLPAAQDEHRFLVECEYREAPWMAAAELELIEDDDPDRKAMPYAWHDRP